MHAVAFDAHERIIVGGRAVGEPGAEVPIRGAQALEVGRRALHAVGGRVEVLEARVPHLGVGRELEHEHAIGDGECAVHGGCRRGVGP